MKLTSNAIITKMEEGRPIDAKTQVLTSVILGVETPSMGYMEARAYRIEKEGKVTYSGTDLGKVFENHKVGDSISIQMLSISPPVFKYLGPSKEKNKK